MLKIRHRLVNLFFHYCQNQKYALLIPYKESSLHVESDLKTIFLSEEANRSQIVVYRPVV